MILGQITADPIGEALGSPFQRFSSSYKIDGLACEDDGQLRLLAVKARYPGGGDFGRFLAAAQGQYESIAILEVMNQRFADYLLRAGFTPGLSDGVSALVWSKNG